MGSCYELHEADMEFLADYNKTHVCNSVKIKFLFSPQSTKLSDQHLEQTIQYLELKHHYDLYVTFKPGEGIDPGRNFQRQWDLLLSHPLVNQVPDAEIVTYWQSRWDKLERPLLRVFMTALENEYHLKIYKAHALR